MKSERKRILMVDDQIVNLALGREILSKVYEVFTVPSGEKMLKLLPKVLPDMILLDIEMPEMNGHEAIKILKGNPETSGIPVAFLTAKDGAGSESEGLSLGAVDYISKPFSPAHLLERIETHLLAAEKI